MQTYKIVISPEDSRKRLDVFLAAYCEKEKLGLSRTFIQDLIHAGNLTIGRLVITKPNYRIKPNDEIEIKLKERKPQSLQPEDIPLEIVYQDEDLALINKPSGMVVHPAPGNYEHTLVNALLHRFKTLSDINPQRPGIVHRLDKDTSGLIVVARNNFTHLALSRQFSKHTIKRKYIALVKGKVEFDEGIIEMPIGRHPEKRKSMTVVLAKNPKYAKTRYRTLRRGEKISVLELEPFTGRTHQLRVHLAFLGHPVLGDTKYGKNNEFIRLALHAKSLGFIHPRSGNFLEFTCSNPSEFKDPANKP